jgi:mannitol 2-dehydrogenase
MERLNMSTRNRLPQTVHCPRYDRSRLTTNIVHIGVGHFHRAHQAVYLDDLQELTHSGEWGICGVGIRPENRQMLEALVPQDNLYTVVERSAESESFRVIGIMPEYLAGWDDTDMILRKMAHPSVRIVTLTITEGGYPYHPATGEPNLEHPDLAADLADPQRPSSAFGLLIEALARRRRNGSPPFTILSCDNLQDNGHITARIVQAIAEQRDPALADWIASEVAFPCSMVDRITPATTEEVRQLVRDRCGLEDAWPVGCEDFRQWVVEDRFCNGRPDWERVGVQMTDDVRPYEMAKIRLLNASHAAMGYPGYLSGYRLIDRIMGDPLFQRYIWNLMEEIVPTLVSVPGMELTSYRRRLLERFANPKIGDTTARICMEGSSRMPKFLVPALIERLAAGGATRLMCLAVAGWLRYLSGTDEQGQPIPIIDSAEVAPRLQSAARAIANDPSHHPAPALAIRELFGAMADSPVCVAQIQRALQSFYAQGARATLTAWLQA